MGVVIKVGRKDPWRDLYCPVCHGSHFVLLRRLPGRAEIGCVKCRCKLGVAVRAGELVRRWGNVK